jgi:hypothetical protein
MTSPARQTWSVGERGRDLGAADERGVDRRAVR